MPSHYDPKKNCRVGTMDEDQFFAECSDDNGAWFGALMKQWTKAGGTLKWGAGGVGLRRVLEGAGEMGVCFLAPAFRGKKDRVELSCSPLVKKLGSERCDRFTGDLRATAGDHVLGKSMISIVTPGTLPATRQKKLARILCEFARV